MLSDSVSKQCIQYMYIHVKYSQKYILLVSENFQNFTLLNFLNINFVQAITTRFNNGQTVQVAYMHIIQYYTFILHGYLPADFMKTAMVSIIKNKTGDTSDKNNYRPIALVTAAFKLLEICILEILESYLLTHDYQFGFKAKHSTDMCIFTVKTLIKYYTDQNTLVYRPISRVVIGREVDYRSRLIYVRYCLTNTTLCLMTIL